VLVSDSRKRTRNDENTMSQRCHEHIQKVRHRIAVVETHRVVGFVHTRAGIDRMKAEIGHREFAEQSRKEAGFVRRMEVDFGQRKSESDRRAQEIVEAGRVGSDRTAAAVLGVEEGACCSLGRQAGRMVSERIEDIARAGREMVAIGHREQEKNNRQCSAVLGREVATGRASWQKVVALEAGERRRSPKRQDMLDSPTWFQRGS
jgi:hypothetical protein